MITLASVGSASSAAEYLCQDNYYTADQTQEASAWFGKGAEVLGLTGKVEEAAFAAVLEGSRGRRRTIRPLPEHGSHRSPVVFWLSRLTYPKADSIAVRCKHYGHASPSGRAQPFC
jgi:conjugative relaxase-like TrwC/TraI family protein